LWKEIVTYGAGAERAILFRIEEEIIGSILFHNFSKLIIPVHSVIAKKFKLFCRHQTCCRSQVISDLRR
jgi:O6-methylguanine-DNA--protein-cysteine methyltransferase